MLSKAGVVTEGFTAVTALIRFPRRVISLMFNKDWALTKTFTTLMTLIQFSTSVIYEVLKKSCVLSKGSPTLLTLKGFSLVWLLWCPIRLTPCLKLFPHWSHLCCCPSSEFPWCLPNLSLRSWRSPKWVLRKTFLPLQILRSTIFCDSNPLDTSCFPANFPVSGLVSLSKIGNASFKCHFLFKLFIMENFRHI